MDIKNGFGEHLANGSEQDGILTIENFIDGQFVSCDSHLDSFDPSTGKVWAKIPDSGEREVQAAVHAAKRAYLSWSVTSAESRSKILNRIADLVEAHLDELAEVESRDQGKPVWLAKSRDLPRAAQHFRFFANLILYQTTECTQSRGPWALNYVLRQPVGVAGLIIPWNLPLHLLSFKIAPAIACANTVVAKPSEMTSVTAWMLARLMNEAGLPPGVVNLVFGTGPKAGQAIVQHPGIELISFTGSTATGKAILEASAPFYKKVSLEMGGKNPCIIFPDANLEACVETTINSSFLNQGEICLCTSRIFVHNTIYDQFLQAFLKQTRSLKVGPPNDPNSKLGALISKEHLAKVKGFLTIAKAEGAVLECGDEELDIPEDYEEGYYMRPTVITNVADTSILMQEEIFGPVTCVVPFVSEDENVPPGSVFRPEASIQLLTFMNVGTVWCNCWLVRDLNMPFGGTKHSGMGREGAKGSIDFFTEEKTVCLKID